MGGQLQLTKAQPSAASSEQVSLFNSALKSLSMYATEEKKPSREIIKLHMGKANNRLLGVEPHLWFQGPRSLPRFVQPRYSRMYTWTVLE